MSFIQLLTTFCFISGAAPHGHPLSGWKSTLFGDSLHHISLQGPLTLCSITAPKNPWIFLLGLRQELLGFGVRVGCWERSSWWSNWWLRWWLLSSCLFIFLFNKLFSKYMEYWLHTTSCRDRGEKSEANSSAHEACRGGEGKETGKQALAPSIILGLKELCRLTWKRIIGRGQEFWGMWSDKALKMRQSLPCRGPWGEGRGAGTLPGCSRPERSPWGEEMRRHGASCARG